MTGNAEHQGLTENMEYTGITGDAAHPRDVGHEECFRMNGIGGGLSCGVDIVRIGRVKKLLAKAPQFLEAVYTEREREWISGKAHRAAGCFAAKEAVSKALGTGIRGFSLKDVEILHDALGKPEALLHGNAGLIAPSARISLSVSHEKKYAVAFAVLIRTL